MRGWFGYLSSFAKQSAELPSFLEQHPRLVEYGDLHPWYVTLGQIKAEEAAGTYPAAGGTRRDGESRRAYLAEMIRDDGRVQTTKALSGRGGLRASA